MESKETLETSYKKYNLINGIRKTNNISGTVGNRNDLLNSRYAMYDLKHGIKTSNKAPSTYINQNFKLK